MKSFRHAVLEGVDHITAVMKGGKPVFEKR